MDDNQPKKNIIGIYGAGWTGLQELSILKDSTGITSNNDYVFFDSNQEIQGACLNGVLIRDPMDIDTLELDCLVIASTQLATSSTIVGTIPQKTWISSVLSYEKFLKNRITADLHFEADQLIFFNDYREFLHRLNTHHNIKAFGSEGKLASHLDFLYEAPRVYEFELHKLSEQAVYLCSASLAERIFWIWEQRKSTSLFYWLSKSFVCQKLGDMKSLANCYEQAVGYGLIPYNFIKKIVTFQGAWRENSNPQTFYSIKRNQNQVNYIDTELLRLTSDDILFGDHIDLVKNVFDTMVLTFRPDEIAKTGIKMYRELFLEGFLVQAYRAKKLSMMAIAQYANSESSAGWRDRVSALVEYGDYSSAIILLEKMRDKASNPIIREEIHLEKKRIEFYFNLVGLENSSYVEGRAKENFFKYDLSVYEGKDVAIIGPGHITTEEENEIRRFGVQVIFNQVTDPFKNAWYSNNSLLVSYYAYHFFICFRREVESLLLSGRLSRVVIGKNFPLIVDLMAGGIYNNGSGFRAACFRGHLYAVARALVDILECNPLSVHIYGVDFFTGSKPYEESYIPSHTYNFSVESLVSHDPLRTIRFLRYIKKRFINTHWYGAGKNIVDNDDLGYLMLLHRRYFEAKGRSFSSFRR